MQGLQRRLKILKMTDIVRVAGAGYHDLISITDHTRPLEQVASVILRLFQALNLGVGAPQAAGEHAHQIGQQFRLELAQPFLRQAVK